MHLKENNSENNNNNDIENASNIMYSCETHLHADQPSNSLSTCSDSVSVCCNSKAFDSSEKTGSYQLSNLHELLTKNSNRVERNEETKITNLSVQNSNDVTIGNKTIFKGPVTINQFLPDSLSNQDGEGFSDFNKSNSNSLKSGKQDYSTSKLLRLSRKTVMLLSASAAAVILLIIIGVTIGLLLKNEKLPQDKPIGNKKFKKNHVFLYFSVLLLVFETDWDIRIIKREEWKAKPPVFELNPFVTTPYRAIIAHTATDGCTTISSCKLRVKHIQNIMMEGGFDDIGYNFLVGGDGMVYEGCGWNKIGIHTMNFNNNSICIAFIGLFSTIRPPDKQLKAAQWILEETVKAGKLIKNYKLYGAKQLIPIESPGELLYNIIQDWPHWTDDIE